MTGDDPYRRLPEVTPLTVTSDTMTDGGDLPRPQYSAMMGVAGGLDESPQLPWEGAPEGNRHG